MCACACVCTRLFVRVRAAGVCRDAHLSTLAKADAVSSGLAEQLAAARMETGKAHERVVALEMQLKRANDELLDVKASSDRTAASMDARVSRRHTLPRCVLVGDESCVFLLSAAGT